MQPAEIVPGADRFGAPEGTPPVAAAFAGDRLLGYAFVNADWVNSTGYSGRPIEILAGLGVDGKITGAKLMAHHEPIVLIGIRRAHHRLHPGLCRSERPGDRRGGSQRAPQGRHRERRHRDRHGDRRQHPPLGEAGRPGKECRRGQHRCPAAGRGNGTRGAARAGRHGRASQNLGRAPRRWLRAAPVHDHRRREQSV